MPKLLLVLVVVFFSGAAIGWKYQSYKYEAQLALWHQKTAEEKQSHQEKLTARFDAIIKERDHMLKNLENAKFQLIKQKKESEHETNLLEQRVNDHAVRLRIAARDCSGNMSRDATNSGRDQGGTEELDPSARSAYFSLRRALNEQYSQLQLCRSVLMLKTSDK